MNEFELIAKITATLPGNAQMVRGAGDDCAVLDLGLPDSLVLFKTDAVVEKVHFTGETPAAKVGRKALARTLSDVAAMAGEPTACLVTLGLPKGYSPDWVMEFYEGLNALAREWNVAVAGGETTLSPGEIFVSVALVGTVARDRMVSRGNARAGEAIFVTGELGGSLAGKHLEFTPRIKEAQWLAREFSVRAMMDLSDGLAGDLRHILRASGVGAELHAEAIPISRQARRQNRADSSAKPPLLAALTDGEDFELLFTVPASRAVALLDSWKETFPETKLTCIGKVVATPGLRLRDKDGIRELGTHGYTHFKQP